MVRSAGRISSAAMRGIVYLVGAGPGDPELLTLRALRLLETADVVLHDDLVSPAVLALISPAAQVRNVGKRCGRARMRQEEIHAQMRLHARCGRTVVRLKGGDPLIFGRAGEEIEALRASGIAFEIVPGVTAASAAAAAAGIALTDRRAASRLLFLPYHCAAGSPGGTTVVVYMPGENYAALAARLRAEGMRDETPCALVSRAACADEQIHRTTVAALHAGPRLAAPVLVIAGEVVAGANEAFPHGDAGKLQGGGPWLERLAAMLSEPAA